MLRTFNVALIERGGFVERPPVPTGDEFRRSIMDDSLQEESESDIPRGAEFLKSIKG